MISDSGTSDLNFLFCVGAQKAATSSLDVMLRSQTDLIFPDKKETKFFCHDSHASNANQDYLGNFGRVPKGSFLCEIDPDYSFINGSLERIAEFHKDAFILFIIRNPVDRAISQYEMAVRRGIEDRPFSTAIREHRHYFNNWLDDVHFSYVDRGFYLQQVREIYALFRSDRIIITTFEDYLADQYGFVKLLASQVGFSLKGNGGFTANENSRHGVKSTTLARFTHGVWPGRDAVKAILPQAVRSWLVRYSTEINKANARSTYVLDEDITFLQSLYYEDLCAVREFLNRQSLWWV